LMKKLHRDQTAGVEVYGDMDGPHTAHTNHVGELIAGCEKLLHRSPEGVRAPIPVTGARPVSSEFGRASEGGTLSL
jgi:hypothetical protein